MKKLVGITVNISFISIMVRFYDDISIVVDVLFLLQFIELISDNSLIAIY